MLILQCRESPRQKMTKNTKWTPQLIGGYKFDETASALQKMIRRGKEYEGCFWAYIFHQSGFGPYVWRRLSIICAEDIGNGTPLAHPVLNSLRNSWERLHKKNKKPSLDKFLFVAQTVLFMCRAEKSRECDSICNLIKENWQSNRRLKIPSIAIDPHTKAGRSVYGRFGSKDGRELERIRLWFEKWGKITNEAHKDKWEDKLREIWRKNALNK